MKSQKNRIKVSAREIGARRHRIPEWTLANGKAIEAKLPFGLMGILNITPDSFYDGGKYNNIKTAIFKVDELLKSGSDIIDIGGQSTRPGALNMDIEEERGRVIPVLCELRKKYPEAIFSIDTFNADIADTAIRNGAAIINDVSAFERDPGLLEILAQYKPAYILTHCATGTCGGAQESSKAAIREILKFFEGKLNILISAGVPETNIAIDPGIGFGKCYNVTKAILKQIEALKIFGRPILAGVSMKSIFGDMLGLALQERSESTAIASAILWQKGVFWHRVHNVAQVRNALYLAHELAC